jgi:hypothetical protein
MRDNLAGENPYDVSRERAWHVIEDCRRDEYLLKSSDRVGEALAARLVEFGKDVVKNQNWVADSGFAAKDRGRGELEGERERPGLSVARVPPSG